MSGVSEASTGQENGDSLCCTLATDTQEEPTCRLCWCEADSSENGQLVSPCACCGTSKYIHLRCLKDWQQSLRSQGQFKRSRHCEICKQPYKFGQGAQVRHFFSSTSQALLESFQCPSWPVLAYRLWRSYIFCSGLFQASKVGAWGLLAGWKFGKDLAKEQTQAFLQLLVTLSDYLGAPYAQVLVCQAATAICLALVSEIVYTSLLGLVGGATVGFFSGYVSAVKGTARVVLACCHQASGLATKVALKVVKLASMVGRLRIRLI